MQISMDCSPLLLFYGGREFYVVMEPVSRYRQTLITPSTEYIIPYSDWIVNCQNAQNFRERGVFFVQFVQSVEGAMCLEKNFEFFYDIEFGNLANMYKRQAGNDLPFV